MRQRQRQRQKNPKQVPALQLHHRAPLVQVHEPDNLRGSTSSRIQAMENVSNFLEALTALDFPPVAMFSIADMEAEEGEDRCLAGRQSHCLVAGAVRSSTPTGH